MAQLSFPANPQIDEVYISYDKAWKWNGLGWEKLPNTSSTIISVPMAVVGFYPGIPVSSEVFLSFVSPWPASFEAGLACSRATASVASASGATYSIKKNGVDVGSVTFATGMTTGAFSSGGFDLVAGDILTVVAPVAPDPTLSDVTMSIAGNRTGGC